VSRHACCIVQLTGSDPIPGFFLYHLSFQSFPNLGGGLALVTRHGAPLDRERPGERRFVEPLSPPGGVGGGGVFGGGALWADAFVQGVRLALRLLGLLLSL
jgi:hypothetical protein